MFAPMSGEPRAFISRNGELLQLSDLIEQGASPVPGKWNFYRQNFSLSEDGPWWVFSKAVPYSGGVKSKPLNLQLHPKSIEAQKNSYTERFNRILSSLENQQINKAVAVVEFPVDGVENAKNLTGDLALHNLAAYYNSTKKDHFYGFLNSTCAWLGITPEILFSFSGQKLNTMALAGTEAPGHNKDLLNNPKERYEHQLVVEDIAERLSCLGEVETDETLVVSAGPLKHLCTPLSVHLSPSDFNFTKCVELLHPTPALGVAPRNKLEPYSALLWNSPRPRWHGAPIGWLSPEGEAECLVGIRGLAITQNHAHVYAGGGLVLASQLADEWQEIVSKAQTVLRFF